LLYPIGEMREKLGKYLGKRRTFQGVFKRFGSKAGYKGPVKTVLVVNLIDFVTKEILTNHLWFTCGKRFDKLDLQEGELVQFDARVTEYLKGYQGRNEFGEEGFQELDYRLSFPTRVRKLGGLPKGQMVLSSLNS
jgi:hypothetical protein